MTTSPSSAAPERAATTPRSRNICNAPSLQSTAASGTPASSKRSAIGAPMVPVPIKSTEFFTRFRFANGADCHAREALLNMATLPAYELFAIRYAEHADRNASENFIGGDPHDGPMPLDYFVWVIRGEDRVYLVDTGFNAQTAAKRNRTVLRSPVDGLQLLDITPEAVTDTVLTHLHYDHAGNVDLFPHSRFHLQDKEMQYATGRYMTHARLRVPFDPDQVCLLVHEVYRDHVCFHDGDWELAPGVTVHLIGGHTLG